MASQDLPRVLDVQVELPPALSRPGRRAGQSARRLKIWQILSNWLCSVIGTCLTPIDIQQVLKRSAISFRDGAYDYEIHGYVVGEAREDGRVGREINKLLDQKFGALVRKVGGEPDEGRLVALWDELCGRGLVAGACWAFISQAHVPEWLKTHAFGEVHMLSHFMGGFNRQSAKELWLADREVGQLAGKLASQRRRAHADLAERDHRIAELEQELQQTRDRLATRYQEQARRDARSEATRQRHLDRGQRRLSATRARLRAVEEENQRLAALVDALAEMAPSGGRLQRSASEVVAGDATSPGDQPGGCILYVGGRCHLLPHLRARAEARAAQLLHHDGGRGEALHALESLVDRADRGVLPDRLHQPSRLPEGQAPAAGQAVRAAAEQQRYLFFARAIEAWHGHAET